jgi:hypothetical protein
MFFFVIYRSRLSVQPPAKAGIKVINGFETTADWVPAGFGNLAGMTKF